jgi:hypothetical protein
MLDDPDIIYDFDDLFDPGVFDEGNSCVSKLMHSLILSTVCLGSKAFHPPELEHSEHSTDQTIASEQ